MTAPEPTAKAERPLEGLEALYGPTIAKAERLKAVRAEFDRIADAAREDYVRVVGQAQAECERAVRAIEREPDPMRPDPATKKERLKAAIAARKEADRKWEELTQARDAVGRAWLAADLLQREIEREP